jgi:tRNA-2-methylthio-N6-dimethylallyladenosine synthase
MRLEDDVPAEVKKRRLAEIQGLQAGISRERMAAWEGRRVPVLVEGPSKRDSSWLSGRISQNWIVNFAGPQRLVGEMVDVTVETAFSNSFQGRATEFDSTRPRAALPVLN